MSTPDWTRSRVIDKKPQILQEHTNSLGETNRQISTFMRRDHFNSRERQANGEKKKETRVAVVA
jgi:hypothetical protein